MLPQPENPETVSRTDGDARPARGGAVLSSRLRAGGPWGPTSRFTLLSWGNRRKRCLSLPKVPN